MEEYDKIDFETLMRARVERIDIHISKLETSNGELLKGVNEIKTALKGSEFSPEKGITAMMKDLYLRVEELERNEIKRDQSDSNIKWIGSIILTILFGLLVYIIQHLPK